MFGRDHAVRGVRGILGALPAWRRVGVSLALCLPFLLLTLSGNARAQALPDLIMTEVSGAPASANTGATFNINNTVRNNNNKAFTTDFRVGLYLSTDNIITPGDTLIGSRIKTGGLGGNTSNGPISTGVTIPVTLTPGTYYYGGFADDTYVVSEADETNNGLANVSTIQVTGPDLTVTAVSGPSIGAPGRTITINNTVYNGGNGSIPATVYVGFYLSADTNITTDDFFLGSRSISSLNSGASSNANTVVTVPTSQDSGTYYLGVIADYTDAVGEFNNNNNALAGNQIQIVNYDLTVTALGNGPATTSPGQTISIDNTVYNGGLDNLSVPFNVYFYLSTDATITTADTFIGYRTINNLNTGQSDATSTNVTIPSSQARGNYYIGAIADPANAILETNEGNNTRASAATTQVVHLDLIVTEVYGPAQAGKGQNINVVNTVYNQGADPVNSSFSVGFYLSTDATITTADTFLGSRSIASLAAGASDTASTSVTIPSNQAVGTYYIGAIADRTDVILETNEGNNTRASAATIAIIGGDLVITEVYGNQASVIRGQPVTLTYTVKNQDAVDAITGNFRVGLYLSTDATITTADTFLGYRTVTGGLNAMASFSESIPVNIDAGAGTYYIGAIADYLGVIAETDEANNSRASDDQITVIDIDLVITNVSGYPATVLPGENITINNTVYNLGTGAANAFKIGFYLSTDATITTGDTLIGERSLLSLAAGTSSSASTGATIPPSQAAGTYYIGAIADYLSDVTETNEGNNSLAGVTTQVVAGDLIVNTVFGSPPSVVAGSPLTITDTVYNVGLSGVGVDFGGVAFAVYLYLSTDATITTADILIGSRSIASLAAGASNSANTTITVPGIVPPGLYYVGAIVDPANAILETNEGNNTKASTSTIQVQGLDLTVTAVSAPDSATPGESITITDTVYNNGSNHITLSFAVGYYLSTDADITTADILIGARSVAGLNANTSSSASTIVTIPATQARGTYWIGVIVDFTNAVAETLEDNNALASATPTQVIVPDLTATAVGISGNPATISPGESITVTDTVQNVGLDAIPTAFNVGLYLSTDGTITTDDRLIGARSVPAGLAAGATSSAGTTVTLPANLAPGTYWIGAIADFTNAVAETNEANNAKAGAATLVPGPDLVMNSVSGPATITPDQSITITDTVVNVGGLDVTKPFYVGLYLSTDATITTDDLFLGKRPVKTLPAGLSDSGSTSVKIPATLNPGNYYLGAIADYTNVIAEINETNNAKYNDAGINQVRGPDLTVTAVSGPASTYPGESITLTSTVANGGQDNISTTFYVGLYLSTDANIDAKDKLIGFYAVPGLNAGASDPAGTGVTIPATLAPGTYYLGAIADIKKNVAETNEANNAGPLAPSTIEVRGPDLTVTDVSGYPATVVPGENITIDNTVYNDGGADAMKSFTVGIYLSANGIIDKSAKLIAKRTVAGLAAGTSDTDSTPVTVPATLAPGTYYVGVLADATNAILETDENNNARVNIVTTVQVLGPDLIMTTVSAPATVTPGQMITVDNTVYNDGGADATKTFTVGIYLSANSVIDKTAKLIGMRTVAGLVAGGSDTDSTQITLPTTLLPGTYYIIAVADATRAVLESDEDNNARAAANSTVVPGPDLTVAVISGPAAAWPGESIDITDMVYNGGDPTDTLFMVGLYLSTDAVLDQKDKLIGKRTVNGLAAGATSSASTTVKLAPNLAPGTYYLIAVADYTKKVAEVNEDNNVLVSATTIEAQGPDLAITAVSIDGNPATIEPGQTIIVHDTVANGGITTPKAFAVGLYLSTDPFITTGDTFIGARVVKGLAEGATDSASTTVKLPATLAPGTYYIGAIADYKGKPGLGQVAEINEDNNNLAGLTTVQVPGPDLMMTIVSGPVLATEGGIITLTNTVTNVSSRSTGQTFYIGLYLSSDADITTNDILIGYRTVAGLAAGANNSASTIVTLPAGVTGTYYIGAIADFNRFVAENYETNNALASGSTLTINP